MTDDMKPRYARGDGGTTWPVVQYGEHDVEWKLRYHPESLTREDRLWLASVIVAYQHLTDPHSVAPREKFARARRAIRVWFYPQAAQRR